tara:strand:- start:72 stop:263 length:192 start_codon:yes stop_codon:yes gene_type:complete
MWAYLLVGAVIDRVGRMGKMPGQGRFNGKCRNVNGIIGDECPLCAGEMALGGLLGTTGIADPA